MAGYKEIVGYVDLAGCGVLRDGIARLVGKREWLYVSQYREFTLPVIGTPE